MVGPQRTSEGTAAEGCKDHLTSVRKPGPAPAHSLPCPYGSEAFNKQKMQGGGRRPPEGRAGGA